MDRRFTMHQTQFTSSCKPKKHITRNGRGCRQFPDRFPLIGILHIMPALPLPRAFTSCLVPATPNPQDRVVHSFQLSTIPGLGALPSGDNVTGVLVGWRRSTEDGVPQRFRLDVNHWSHSQSGLYVTLGAQGFKVRYIPVGSNGDLQVE